MSGLYCSIFPEHYNKVFDKRIFSQQCYKVKFVTWCRPLTNNAPQQKSQNSSHLILSTLWELADWVPIQPQAHSALVKSFIRVREQFFSPPGRKCVIRAQGAQLRMTLEIMSYTYCFSFKSINS